MFSLNDIDRLLEIKDLIEQGVNMAGIKEIFTVKERCCYTITRHRASGKNETRP